MTTRSGRGRAVVRGGPLGVQHDEHAPAPAPVEVIDDVHDIETEAEGLAARMLAELQRREYKTGSTGVEMHLRRALPVDGYLTPVAIHYRIVIKPPVKRKEA